MDSSCQSPAVCPCHRFRLGELVTVPGPVPLEAVVIGSQCGPVPMVFVALTAMSPIPQGRISFPVNSVELRCR